MTQSKLDRFSSKFSIFSKIPEFFSRQKRMKRSKPCILKFLKGSGNRKTTNQSGRLFKSVNLVFIRRQLDRDLSFRSQRVSAAVSRSESAAD